MKTVFLPLMVIASIVAFLTIPNAFSDIAQNDKYLIEASGFLSGDQKIFDSTIALQISTGTTSGSTLMATLENGFVTISDITYLNTGTWQTSILRDGKYMVLQGDAQDANGNIIHVNLFGRYVATNQDGSLYYLTGKITGTETLRVIYSAKVVSLTAPVVTPPTTTTTQPSQPSQPTSGATTVTVNILPGAHNIDNQQYFSISSLRVSPGTTIIWTNSDTVPHRIVSGVASATIGSNNLPIFTADGKIDTGVIAPGQSYQYTVTSFDTRNYLSPVLAKQLNLDPAQTAGDITFFDPTYTWMIGIIAPSSTPSTTTTQQSMVQINILPGASVYGTGKFLSSSSATINPGTTILLQNNDNVPHRLLSGQIITTTKGSSGPSNANNAPQFTPDGRIDTGVIAPGQTYKLTISGTGSTQFYDPTYTWINGQIVSLPQSDKPITPVQISILPGSSLPQGSATQQQFNQYNRYYSPSDIQIAPGTPVIWTNNDSIEHRIYSGISTQQPSNPFEPDGKIASGNIAPGQTFEVVVNATGIIRFYDPSYTWMNGMIVSIPSTTSKIIGAPSHNPGLH